MSDLLKLIIFLGATGGFVYLSWESLRNPRSHGFYRFFAFETIAALVLLNLDYWFYEPFSLHQIISWLLLIVSGFLVIHGFQLLRMVGNPKSERNDDLTLIGIEKTSELVTVGAYRYIRHPMYSSGLIGVWGVFFKHLSWAGICLAVITTLFWTITAKIEEAENIRFFGAGYQSYMKKTKMFVPFLY